MTLQEILYLFNDLEPKLRLGEKIDNPKIKEYIHIQMAPVILLLFKRRNPSFKELTRIIDFCILCFTAGYNFRKLEEDDKKSYRL